MATAGLIIGWKDTKAGKEAQAGELFGASIELYTAKVQDGTLESFEPVLLSRHGGDLNGFIILRGEPDKIDAFKRSDEFNEFTLKAIHCIDGFGVVDAYVGEAVGEQMGKWMALIGS